MNFKNQFVRVGINFETLEQFCSVIYMMYMLRDFLILVTHYC